MSTKREKANSVEEPADIIFAAGESSQTDPTEFIEQQREMLFEMKRSKLCAQDYEETLPSHSGESQQALPSLQEQLREKEEREANLMRQLRRTEEQKDSLQRELVQKLRDKDEQLREKEQEQENSQRQLNEMEQRLTTCQEQLQEREAGLLEQLREKEQDQENSQRQLSDMEQRLTNYQEQTQEREAGLLEQVREKEQQQESSQRQLSEMEQRLTNYQEQLEEREAGLLEQLRQKEQEQENSQRQLTEMEQRLTNFERQIAENEAERANLERQLAVKDQEVNELETSLSAAQQAISNQVRRQATCDWVIARDEIQIKEKCLGRGGWGSVNEGTYCGCVVAVKQIHELILSPHNRRLFEREMNIASRCRHPCLLQFIGATNDEGSPLFVTELMETSLRALLQQQQFSEAEICVISVDVALALNYLHQRRPSPILHRDVSSANVLLWRQGDQWRGKVSDYGTANFMQQTMTIGPGAPIYSAPEAHTSNQTVKVDVYSFGVLLCEMCIRELPDPRRREEQITLMANRGLRGLVRRCLQTDPGLRPDMPQIIHELEQFKGTL